MMIELRRVWAMLFLFSFWPTIRVGVQIEELLARLEGRPFDLASYLAAQHPTLRILFEHK